MQARFVYIAYSLLFTTLGTLILAVLNFLMHLRVNSNVASPTIKGRQSLRSKLLLAIFDHYPAANSYQTEVFCLEPIAVHTDIYLSLEFLLRDMTITVLITAPNIRFLPVLYFSLCGIV